MPAGTLPDSRVLAVIRDDDFTFGVLSSLIHTFWSLSTCSWHGVGNDPTYNAGSCFETFPFPESTDDTDSKKAEIEKWAKYVVTMREHLLAADAKATLTSLYNEVENLRQAPDTTHSVYGLLSAHHSLDKAVAAAYGWEWPLSEEEVLSRLLELNLSKSSKSDLAEGEA